MLSLGVGMASSGRKDTQAHLTGQKVLSRTVTPKDKERYPSSLTRQGNIFYTFSTDDHKTDVPLASAV